MRSTLYLLFLIRLCFICDAQPSFIWAKQYSGNHGGSARAISADNAGNVYTTGNFMGTMDFDPSPGTFTLSSGGYNPHVFVSKIDGAGNLLWAKQFGGSGQEDGVSLTIDRSGNVYASGRFYGTTDFDPGPGTYNLTGNNDFFIAKLSPLGNLIWAKQLKATINSIALDSANNIFSTGLFQNTTDFDPSAGVYNLTATGGSDIFICKLDSNGLFQWAKQMGGTSSEACYSIAVDKKGNPYVSGFFSGTSDFDPGTASYNLTSNGGTDIFICKLNSLGSFVWAEQIGGTGNEENFSIAVSNKNGVGITGVFVNAVDFDPGPGTYNLTATVGTVFTCKLDTSGKLMWAKQMSTGTPGGNVGYDIAFDSNDNVFTAGIFSYTVDFDPGPGTFNLSTLGGTSMFISKLDPSGNFICAGNIEGISTNYNCMTIDKRGNVFSTGYFAGSTDFNAGLGVYSLTAGSLADIFITKWSCGISTGQPLILPGENSFEIFPNPTSGVFEVHYQDTESGNIQINIYDTKGQLVYKEISVPFSNKYHKKIDLGKQAKGVYYIELILNRKKITSQLILV